MRKTQKRVSLVKRIFSVLLCLFLVAVTAVFVIDAFVRSCVRDCILTSEQASELQDVDCILVLGCGVRSDGTPSDMLHDRLRRSLELYEQGAAPKLLMSGDHGDRYYNEVEAMKKFAVDAGVASGDVFMDHAGFSTYESMYRAVEIFQAKKIIIVTQGYHLHRALYIARALGLEAYGVSSDYRNYSGQLFMDAREVLARVKDFVTVVIRPEPTYTGEAIPIWGNGDLTNDENSQY